MATTMTLYKNFVKKLGNKEIDLDTDTFKVMLVASTYTPDADTHDEKADVTNELSTANGYTAGGASLASLTWNLASSTVTWDAADLVFTASGGSLVARYAVIYDDTATGDPLVAYILLDSTPADVTVTTGNTLTITWSASGIVALTIS